MNRVLALFSALMLSVPQMVLAQGAPAAPAAPVAAPTAAPAPAPAAQASAPAPAAATANAPEPKSIDSMQIDGLAIQQGGLTIDDTVRRALAVSSTMGEKQAELDAANARITQTTVQFVPKLGLRASYMRLSEVDNGLGEGAIVGARTAGPLGTNAAGDVVDSAGNPVFASPFEFPAVNNQFSLSANLTIPLSDYLLRLSDAAAGAEASREAARLALQAAESKVRTDARVLYYNWLRSHAQVFLANKAVERTLARLEDAKSAQSVGRLSNADVMRVEALVANAKLGAQQAESLRALIGAQLAILMRDVGGGYYTIGSELPVLNVATGPVSKEQADAMLADAKASRLELKAIDAAIDALDHGQSAIAAGAYPRLDAIGEVTYANPNQRYFPTEQEWNASWSVGVVASWTFDAPFAADAQAKELRANAAALHAQREGLTAMVVNETVTAALDVQRAGAALVAGETSVRAGEEAYRVATDLFRVGRGTTSDLIDAESDLLASKLAVMNARIDLTIAAIKLQYALGKEPAQYASASRPAPQAVAQPGAQPSASASVKLGTP